MLFFHPPYVGPGDSVGQGATGSKIRDQHSLLGVDQLCRLGHEVHSGEHDHVGGGLQGQVGQRQRVTRDIGGQVIDVWRHVIVGGNDGVAFGLQLRDLIDQRLKSRNLLLREDI